MQPSEKEPHIEVRGLEASYGGRAILRDITFTIRRGDVFVIMGGSGSGKSTLLRHMIGLNEPTAGEVLYGGQSFTRAGGDERAKMLRRFGVLYQRGALWGSMTLAENIGLVLEEYTELPPPEVLEIAGFKLAIVGLAGFENHLPGEVSGGMQKRAGIARAMALDPEILFLDEPGSGLDPVTARRLDELILALRDSLNTTIVAVTHDLASIFTIADDGVLLDPEEKTVIARGNPRELLETSTDARVQRFLTRGDRDAPARTSPSPPSRPSPPRHR